MKNTTPKHKYTNTKPQNPSFALTTKDGSHGTIRMPFLKGVGRLKKTFPKKKNAPARGRKFQKCGVQKRGGKKRTKKRATNRDQTPWRCCWASASTGRWAIGDHQRAKGERNKRMNRRRHLDIT